METILVWVIVSAAALFAVARLFFRRGPAREEGSCSGNCSSCAFAEGSTGCATARKDDGAARPHRLDVIPALAAVVAAALPAGARAADTVETFDAGAWDVELYAGADGLGTPAGDRAVFGEAVVGHGLARGLSAYVASALQADGDLGGRQPDLRLGLFGTPVDLDRFDLDLMLEVGGGGDDFASLWVVPGVELNLDLEAPIGSWGPYLRVSVPVNGERHRNADGSTTFRTDHAFDLNPGLQWTPREGHQLLAEYVVALNPGEGDAPAAWDAGGVALGYNVVVSEAVELITQASLAPGAGDRWVPGVMLGLIATLPGAP